MSWWVGKNREEFNAELQLHVADIMRRGGTKKQKAAEPLEAPVAVAVIEAQPEPEPTPSPTPDPRPTCERCGASFDRKVGTSGRFCSRECYETPDLKSQEEPWFHESTTPPRHMKRRLRIAKAWRRAIESSGHASTDPQLIEATVIMACGFFLEMRGHWIVKWTGYPRSTVRRVTSNLRHNGIWLYSGHMACKWLEMMTTERLTKTRISELELALWLDALVAKGDITRETRDGEFFYGAKR